ncbi:MAG: hypothetical protein ACRCRZ_01385 [Metamycoplasmataceae bacterium]
MEKFYCLYDKKNHPFVWKLKPARKEIMAYFKSRHDCINYYLSLKNEGTIWFQKDKNDLARGLIPRFEGSINTQKINNNLIHSISFHPSTKILNPEETKSKLYKLWKIDSKTGEDLVALKNIDRKKMNINSFLMYDDFIKFSFDKEQESNAKKAILIKKNKEKNEELLSRQEEIKDINLSSQNDSNKYGNITINFNTSISKDGVIDVDNSDKINVLEEHESINKMYHNDEKKEDNYELNDDFFYDDDDDFFEEIEKEENFNKKDFFNYNYDNKFYEGSQNFMNNNNKTNSFYVTNNNPYYPQQNNGTIEFSAVPGQILNTNLNPLGNETMIISTPAYNMNYNTNSFEANPIPSVVTEVTRTEYYTAPTQQLNNYVQPTTLIQPNYDYMSNNNYMNPQPMMYNTQVMPVPNYNFPNNQHNNNSEQEEDTLENDIKKIRQDIEQLKDDFKETKTLSFNNANLAEKEETKIKPIENPAPQKQMSSVTPSVVRVAQPNNIPNQKRSIPQQTPIKKKKIDGLTLSMIIGAAILVIGVVIFISLYFAGIIKF